MKLAIVGVTGMVGREMLEVLSERRFPLTELVPVASKKSFGKLIFFNGKSHKVITLSDLLEKNVDIALFSAGGEISKIWAPKLAAKGVKVVDNSSYWRMCSKHKLIVPEINGKELKVEDMIIANPNCSTIQLVMALAPLHKKFVVRRVILSTYQAVSGTGKKALEQFEDEELKTGNEISVERYRMSPIKIRESIQSISVYCDNFVACEKTEEQAEMRELLLNSVRVLLKKLEQKV